MIQNRSERSKDNNIGEASDKSASITSNTRPPTVLQVLPELVTGGVERAPLISQVLLWKAEGGRSWFPPAVRWPTNLPGRCRTCDAAGPLKNPFVIQKNIHRLADLAVAENVDIIHARSRASAWSAMYAAKKTGKISSQLSMAPMVMPTA